MGQPNRKSGAKSGIGASAVALVAGLTLVAYGVEVKAAASNAAQVYVGLSSSVTAGSADGTDGFELSKGESVFLPVSMIPGGDLSKVFVIGSAGTQKVLWAAV